jgi:hypothetical protein
MKLPFSEKQLENNTFVRTFSSDIDSHELKWHRDKEDRTVTSLNENDWLFQRDNKLPQPIKGTIEIKANEWHRIIKGTGDLVVKVLKHDK